MKVSAAHLFLILFLGLWASQAPAVDFGAISNVGLESCDGPSSEEPNPPESRRCGGQDGGEPSDPPQS